METSRSRSKSSAAESGKIEAVGGASPAATALSEDWGGREKAIQEALRDIAARESPWNRGVNDTFFAWAMLCSRRKWP